MNIRPIDANALIEELDNINPVDYGAMSSYETHNGAREALSDAVMRVNDAPTLSLNTLRDAIYQDAVDHGLWEEVEKDSIELSEEEPPSEKEAAYTFHRRVYATKLVFFESDELLSAAEESNWENLQEELADVVIQAFSTAGYLGIDIDAAIRRKMEINKKRPWKHGKETDGR